MYVKGAGKRLIQREPGWEATARKAAKEQEKGRRKKMVMLSKLYL